MSTDSAELISPHDLGWAEHSPDDPEVVELREHLLENNGIHGLERFQPHEIDRAVEVFRRDGFVVVENVLTPEQTEFLRAGCDEMMSEIVTRDNADRAGNRGSHRYSFGGTSSTRSMLHRPEWQMLLDLPTLTPIIEAIFENDDYILRAASGDFCLAGAVNYQPLHADVHDFTSKERSPVSSFHDPSGRLTMSEIPTPYMAINFLPQDVTPLNGPTRQIPGSQYQRGQIPSLETEPEWMRLSTVCPAPAGAVQIRDTRAWHGGTPNVSDRARAIPNLEIYAPWFRESLIPGINRSDWEQLSERARKMTQFVVADSAHPITPEIMTPEAIRMQRAARAARSS